MNASFHGGVSANFKYQRFITPCDCSYITMGEAAQHVGPSFVYELRVNPARAFDMRNMLKQFAVEAEGNPFAPHVNLAFDATYKTDEWSLHANDRAFGSEGA